MQVLGTALTHAQSLAIIEPGLAAVAAVFLSSPCDLLSPENMWWLSPRPPWPVPYPSAFSPHSGHGFPVRRVHDTAKGGLVLHWQAAAAGQVLSNNPEG